MDPPLRAREQTPEFGLETSDIVGGGEVMLTVFWDSQGPILGHYQERGTTVNSAHYNEMLCDKLKPVIRTKRQGLLSKGVALLHDNAHPHTAAHTVETLCHLNFEVLEHPRYSPDLAPSDYHLFGLLKDALRLPLCQ
jgi:histone-lysine N-methyltransferase SETMAR